MPNPRSHTPVIIIGVLFFLFGFITWINGPLISYLQLVCDLGEGAAPFYVTFAFYIAYLFTALPMARVLRTTGMKRGMMYGLFTIAAGALFFIPAALERSYPLFLVGLFVIGTGLSLLQTASNPYITVVGPIESAAARISVMGICNKMAGVLAPLVLGVVLLGDANTLEAELALLDPTARELRLDEIALRVVNPYIGMAVALVLLGFWVGRSPLPEIDAELDNNEADQSSSSVLAHRNLVLGAIALFLYVGVEVIAGDTIGLYAESQGIPKGDAAKLTSATLLAMVLGYIVGIICIPRWLKQSTALAASAVLGIVLSLLIALVPGMTSVWCVALLGLANALVWPAIWPLAMAGLGAHTKTGGAILVMAIAGGAVLPLAYGALKASPVVGPQSAYWLLIPCYVFILWYGLLGHRRTTW